MRIISIGMPAFVYVELYLGFNDLNWGYIRSYDRKDGGCHECCVGLRGGCGVAVYYDDRCDGALGRADGDRTEVGADCKADAGNTAFY